MPFVIISVGDSSGDFGSGVNGSSGGQAGEIYFKSYFNTDSYANADNQYEITENKKRLVLNYRDGIIAHNMQGYGALCDGLGRGSFTLSVPTASNDTMGLIERRKGEIQELDIYFLSKDVAGKIQNQQEYADGTFTDDLLAKFTLNFQEENGAKMFVKGLVVDENTSYAAVNVENTLYLPTRTELKVEYSGGTLKLINETNGELFFSADVSFLSDDVFVMYRIRGDGSAFRDAESTFIKIVENDWVSA